MYRCKSCGGVVGPRNPALWITVETREMHYRPREHANKIRISGKKKPLLRIDPGGVGNEIVRELKVCGSCHEKFHAGELDTSRI
jgi:hypothetical protein